MKRNMFETILGAVVLVLAGVFAFFAASMADLGTSSGYEVRASFNKIGGLTKGNDVRISGVKVGSVRNIQLDPDTFRAVAILSINDNVRLPSDSIAQVASEGLLGGNFLQISPGIDDEYLSPGESLVLTQPPVDLMDLLGRFIFSANEEK